MSGIRDLGRAVPPAVRPSSLVWYPLDEVDPDADSQAVVGGSGFDLSQEAAEPIPDVVKSPMGRAKRFTGGQILTATGSAAARDAIEDSWTMHVLLRMRATPTGTDVVFGYFGLSGDAGAPDNNFMAAMRFDSTLRPCMFWENGAGGANVQTDVTDYALPVNKWRLVTWRKTITIAGPGPVGRCTLDFFVNGVSIETFLNVQNTSGGVDAKWHLGAQLSGGGSVSAPVTADIDFAGVYSAALTDDDIANDWRRLRQQVGIGARRDVAVFVEDGLGDFRDLTDLDGVDWLDDITINDSGDQPTAQATITLLPERDQLSIAGLRQDSKLNLTDVADPLSFQPLLKSKREIEAKTAIVPIGIRARPDDLSSRFHGRIDRVQWGGERATLECRDLAGIFVRTQIEKEFGYGDDAAPIALVSEVQAIFDDNDNAVNGLALRPARTSSYDPITVKNELPFTRGLAFWEQKREAVLAAVRTIVGASASDARMVFDENPDFYVWRFTLFEPERDRLDADFIVTDDEWTAISEAEETNEDTRNVVEWGYPGTADLAFLDAATLEATLPAGFAVEEVGQDGVDDQGNRLPAFLRIIATAEAARDGRSYSAVAEGSVTQLDTQAETARGALGYLRDLKDGDYLFGGKSPSLVDASIRDIMRLQPGRKHSRAQKLAASRVQIRMSADKAEATISLRGTPSVGFDRWLSIESRSGNARPPSLRSDQGFADTDYGRRLEDFRNMTEKSQSQKGGRFLQTFNADFARKVRGDGHPPDGWQVDSPDIGGSPAVSVWNGDILFDATTTLSGGQAVKFLNTDAFLRSDLVSIQGGSLPYTVEMTILRKTGDPSFLVGQILWYDVGGVFIPPASPNFVISASTTGVFETRRTRAEIAPATARFAAVQVRAFDAGGGLPFDQAWLDQATIIRTSREWRATFQDETSQKLNTKDAYQLVTLDEEIRDFGENFATGTSSATCTEDGLYVIGGGIYVDKNGGTLVYVQAKVEIDRGPGFVDLICGSTGADPAGDREARDHVFDDVELEKGDVLRLQARADWSGSKPSLVRGEFNTYLFGKLKSTD